MATRQYLPKARRVWERRRWPPPEDGGRTATVSFSEHRRRWHTVGSSTRETLPPFRPSGLSRTGLSESVLGSIQSGVRVFRGS
jgi:hypothetical protein